MHRFSEPGIPLGVRWLLPSPGESRELQEAQRLQKGLHEAHCLQKGLQEAQKLQKELQEAQELRWSVLGGARAGDRRGRPYTSGPLGYPSASRSLTEVGAGAGDRKGGCPSTSGPLGYPSASRSSTHCTDFRAGHSAWCEMALALPRSCSGAAGGSKRLQKGLLECSLSAEGVAGGPRFRRKVRRRPRNCRRSCRRLKSSVGLC